jgi:flagellar protein FlaJ
MVLGLIIGIITKNILFMTTLPFVVGFLGWLAGTIIVLMIPKQNAIARGNACSIELPFALRHMSTELRAGLGLYKTLQAVASSNYGALSEEFSRTITEIEEGVDTSAALKHMALRTQSKPLKTTINHMLRAMRIGGNLSEAMTSIAKDVSEDLKERITMFAQNMNFFAVIFIFLGIIMPVAIIILGSIRNSAIASVGDNLFKSVPLTLDVLIIIYFIIIPIIFAGMNFMVYRAQPKM